MLWNELRLQRETESKELHKQTADNLRTMLKDVGEKVSGNKSDLVMRYLFHLQTNEAKLKQWIQKMQPGTKHWNNNLITHLFKLQLHNMFNKYKTKREETDIPEQTPKELEFFF